MVVVLGSGSTTNGVGGRGVHEKSEPIQQLRFRQALRKAART